ncbi:MAG: head GIN domain-containing protein [Saprospiraceae bacterium]|nr:head GIN domain-containing protein [Saprospiraceae bacterium]
MKTAYLLLLSFIALGLWSCEDEYSADQIVVTYDTIPFEKIELATSSDIRIVQASYYQVVVEGEERDVYDTEVRIADNLLIIEEHGSNDQRQVITIYVPEIRQFDAYGSSDIYGESQFRQNGNMYLGLFGSGEIDMYLDTDNLDIFLSGSGDFSLEGFADNVDIGITGSGWVRSFNLNSDFSDITLSGSGSAEVTVDNDLDISISGSGDVFYKGHPDISTSITGSGKVINAN